MAEELLVIGIIVLAILVLWGTKRIPDIARASGKATRDVVQAYKEGLSSADSQQRTQPDLLIETAHKLGITTEGKNREELSEEIIKTVKASV